MQKVTRMEKKERKQQKNIFVSLQSEQTQDSRANVYPKACSTQRPYCNILINIK